MGEVEPQDVGLAVSFGKADDGSFSIEPPHVAAHTRVSGTSRTKVNTTPAWASAARAARKPSGTDRLVIAGSVRATWRMARMLSAATLTSSADRSTSRNHSAVFCSATAKAWLRRNETRGCIQVCSNASGVATRNSLRIFSTLVVASSRAEMTPFLRSVALSNLSAQAVYWARLAVALRLLSYAW